MDRRFLHDARENITLFRGQIDIFSKIRFWITIYKINWLYISVACVIKCRQVCFKCRRSVKLCSCSLYHAGEHARTHARMHACSCIEICLSARGCTLVDQGNFYLTCVSFQDAGYAPFLGCSVCVGSCHCCHLYLFLGVNTNSTAAACAFARAYPRIFRLIREGRVVFVSVYALGVCTSASGLWHFLDYLNI